jgi:hypothetical protein
MRGGPVTTAATWHDSTERRLRRSATQGGRYYTHIADPAGQVTVVDETKPHTLTVMPLLQNASELSLVD